MARVVTIGARPQPMMLDPAKTAVIVVDMQNDFGSKGGMFDRAGIDISGIRRAIAPTSKVLAAARRAGMKIVYLKMGYHADLSDLGAADSPNRVGHLAFGVGSKVTAPDGRESRILVRDTWSTDILDELKPEPSDLVVYKHRFSGFYQTDLAETLARLGVRHLVFTGCTTSVCVEATVRDAMYRDYLCLLLEDCMSQPPLGDTAPGANHNSSLAIAGVFFGSISDSSRFTEALAV